MEAPRRCVPAPSRRDRSTRRLSARCNRVARSSQHRLRSGSGAAQGLLVAPDELRGESKMGPLVSLLVHAGAEVEEVRRGKASLEDVFLTLMEEEQR